MQEKSTVPASSAERQMRHTLALVLAGGRGSRLKELTRWRAKPALPFGGKYRIIDFVLSNCVNSGIRRIGVLTQYAPHSLIRHLQYGWNFLRHEIGEFVAVLPASQDGAQGEQGWYCGTADAIYQNIDMIARYCPGHVFVLAGDHVYTMDYGRMLMAHLTSGAELTVGCIEVPRESARAFGVMSVDAQGRVEHFLEKPADPPGLPGRPQRSLVSMGIYVFDAQVLLDEVSRDHDDPHSSHDFGADVLPGMIARGARVFAYPFVNQAGRPDYWRDVGTIAAYWEANMDLCAIEPALNLYDADWPIWTYQPQRPPAKFAFDEDRRRGMALDALVADGVVLSGASVRRCIVSTDCFLHSYARVEDSILLPQVEIGRHCRIRRAIIDRGCVLPPGTEIGYDVEHDRERFCVDPDSGIVVVTPVMLGRTFPLVAK
ncbi:glucose-1-phosphate adenylyltransferase [Tepidiphilus olei]|uniref:glucose-1-phosphate adenylyltransferase n=1 Tax=Tepidiphilus olei TaxID=2502184 RepID=UPI00115E619A